MTVEVAALVRDLGGHDLADLVQAYEEADRVRDRPSVIFAYTIKARGLPTEGDPGNHSALLSVEQWNALATTLGADAADPWNPFADGSAERALCHAASQRLQRVDPAVAPPVVVPVELGQSSPRGSSSTQHAFGRFFSDLAHTAPEVAKRVVTVSPDVASSTNLGGWINRVGIWNASDRRDWFADDRNRLLRWRESTAGQHIELGIAEGNLVGLLGELGVTWSRDGQPLFPIGTIYDPFVTRALEPWSFGIYAGGQSILVGTPSGITLAPEGGAHQSVITPSIGLEQPGCLAWEPAFGQDLEWTLLRRPQPPRARWRHVVLLPAQHAADRPVAGRGPGRPRRRESSAVSTSSPAATRSGGRAACRRRRWWGSGWSCRRSLRAADELARGGHRLRCPLLDLGRPRVPCHPGPPRSRPTVTTAIVDRLLPADRAAPIVTVVDGHPHTLAFLAASAGVRGSCLGVDDFGQVGDVDDLYRHFGIDTPTIVGAVWDLLDAANETP